MFPKISRKIENNQESIKIQFLKESFELILDKEKCVGCGTCSRVCPHDAVSRGPVGASKRYPTTKDIIPQLYDPKKCVFCGTCVVMCPFSALTLKKNGEPFNLADIPIVAQNAIGKLDFEAKKLDSGVVVKQYTKGTISIVDEECAGGCSTCAEVCPSGAITEPPKSDKGWEKTPNVVVDSDKCVYCGACDNACPTGAIKLEITEVKHSGDFNEIFWNAIEKRIKQLKWSKKEA